MWQLIRFVYLEKLQYNRWMAGRQATTSPWNYNDSLRHPPSAHSARHSTQCWDFFFAFTQLQSRTSYVSVTKWLISMYWYDSSDWIARAALTHSLALINVSAQRQSLVWFGFHASGLTNQYSNGDRKEWGILKWRKSIWIPIFVRICYF